MRGRATSGVATPVTRGIPASASDGAPRGPQGPGETGPGDEDGEKGLGASGEDLVGLCLSNEDIVRVCAGVCGKNATVPAIAEARGTKCEKSNKHHKSSVIQSNGFDKLIIIL